MNIKSLNLRIRAGVKSLISFLLSYVTYSMSIAFWIIVFVLSITMLFFIPDYAESWQARILTKCSLEPKANNSEPPAACKLPEITVPQKLDKIKIFDINGKYYAEWERKEAVKFGFDELLLTINYLFIAAGAILAFIGKSVIEPAIKKERNKYLASFWVIWFLTNCAIGCALSIFFGFAARSMFITIGNKEFFSIYDEIGVSFLFQEMTFFLAIIFLMLAIALAANNKGLIQNTKGKRLWKRRRR
jgi:hypothetical protein